MAGRDWTADELLEGIRARDRRALARAISVVERGLPVGEQVLAEAYPLTGRAAIFGVTGPPGAGKSTLVGALVRLLRGLGKSIGVISVDPSSPFTSGALLGDRIRLTEHFLDPDVFIRSMGTRGHLGGVAEATLQATLLLDAFGKDVIVVETVGTGQTEVEVAGIADVVVLVLMPGGGDSVQALKAGIMEIPDVIAVNKMDHPGAKAMLADLRSIVALDPDAAHRPDLLLTEALRGDGVPELWEALERRRDALAADGRLAERRRRNLAGEVVAVATSRLAGRLRERLGEEALAGLIVDVQERRLDPVSAAERLVEEVTGDGAADAR